MKKVKIGQKEVEYDEENLTIEILLLEIIDLLNKILEELKKSK